MKIQIPVFDEVRVLVVGDVMLDRYWYGAASRISPEAPVPVVRVDECEERPGGAGNVAINIAALGAHTILLGLTGGDEAAGTLERSLVAAGVECRFQEIEAASTITKLRVLSRHQQLIRLDFEDGFDRTGNDALHAEYEESLVQADVVVLSDYGKGTLHRVERFIASARDAGKPVLVDPKGGDFSPYRGATMITPNLAEFEAVAGPCSSEQELVGRSARMIERLGLRALLVTRGEHGMTLMQAGRPELHLPAQAREVFDVTGAGDTVVAVLSAAMAAGLDLPRATALANRAAGIVVGKLGAATVSVPELRTSLRRGEDAGFGVLSEEQLLIIAAEARGRGERIVMTNGCFDILHAGHVSYLAAARQLGDRLIVAVNDDASVRRLKGEGRPVNSLERRMSVLAGLESVDWVVPFSEDTPEAIVCRLSPDVLVKGGDYRTSEIAGHECVQANGGRVVALEYSDGCSTTAIIDAIRRQEKLVKGES